MANKLDEIFDFFNVGDGTIWAIRGLLGLGFVAGGSLVYVMVDDLSQAKVAREYLGGKITESVNKHGGALSKVNPNCFNWFEDESGKYFFELTGNALTLDGESLDFFGATYRVNEKQYIETTEGLENHDKSLISKELIEDIAEIIQDAELVETTVLESVATNGVTKATGFSNVDEPIITSVSTPIVNESTVNYVVKFIQSVLTLDGEVAVVTSETEVEYEKNKTLEENPSMIFMMAKQGSKVKLLNRTINFIEKGKVLEFGNKKPTTLQR